jgi:integrase/recombinase XerD
MAGRLSASLNLMSRTQVGGQIRKRARAAGFLTPVGMSHLAGNRHSRVYLENDGRLEHAQQMAGHQSPRTTKLYDRIKDEFTGLNDSIVIFF